MVAITVVCVVLFLLTLDDFLEIAVASIVWCIIPTPLVIAALFARGDVQAFAIGAVIPWATFILLRLPSEASFIAASIWLIPMCVICGVIAAVTRRWIDTA
jgi:hypothetical protein